MKMVRVRYLTAVAFVLLQTCNPPDSPVPAIHNVDPETGVQGIDIFIEGDFMDYANGVFLGNFNLIFAGINQDSLVATIPEDIPAGDYKLYITSSEGKSNEITYTIMPAQPFITGTEPLTASVNDTLIIRGNFFSGNDLEVHIADLVITGFIQANDSLISLLVMNNFKSGDLTVVNNNGPSNIVYFNFSDGSDLAPTIDHLDHNQGIAGGIITITGNNFAIKPLTIIFPPNITLKENEDFEIQSPTILRITIPDGAVTGYISIGNMYDTIRIPFEILAPPVIKVIRPKSNSAGGPMLIYGKNLANVKKISFGNNFSISGPVIQHFNRGENEEIIALKVPANIPAGEYQVKALFANEKISSNDTSFTVLTGTMTMPKYLPSIVVPNPPPVNILSNLNNNWLVMDNQEKRMTISLDFPLDPEHPQITFDNISNAGTVNIEDNSIILNGYYGKLDLAYTTEKDTVRRLILTPLEKGNQVEMIFPIYIESLEPSAAHPGDSVIIHGRYFLENDSRNIIIDNNFEADSIGFRRISEDKILIGIPENILPGEHTLRIYYDGFRPSNALRLTINSK